MRVVLLSRYPRVDTPGWKQRLVGELLETGIEVLILYTRSSLLDQARAGLRDSGLAVFARYRTLRTPGGIGEPTGETLRSWAQRQGIPVFLHDRTSDDDTVHRLRSLCPDAIVLAGADIVPRAVLEIPKLGTLNGHFGLLPRYRGYNVTEWSIYNDDPIGVSVHLVDSGIDTGPIVSRTPLPVFSGDRLEDLRPRHQEASARLLAEACRALETGLVEATPQRPSDGRQYYRMHPALRAAVDRKLAAGAYKWCGAPFEQLVAAMP